MEQNYKRSHNTPRSKGSLVKVLKEDYLDCEDVLDMLARLVHKTQDFPIHQFYDIPPVDLKSKKVQYKKSIKGKKDENSIKGRKDRKNERGKKSNQRNKINQVISKNSSFKTSVYYYIIYKC